VEQLPPFPTNDTIIRSRQLPGIRLLKTFRRCFFKSRWLGHCRCLVLRCFVAALQKYKTQQECHKNLGSHVHYLVSPVSLVPTCTATVTRRRRTCCQPRRRRSK